MVKFSAQEGDKLVIGLGLSRANCERLLEGIPIMVEVEEMIPTLRMIVFLFAGETEETMYDEMRQGGVLDSVEIHISPRLGLTTEGQNT